MQINKIELAKTISDFMFLNINEPENKAKKLFKVKHSLDKRGHGFEKYMQYYFEKFHNYTVFLNGTTNSFDGGIDLKGKKILNGEELYLIAQCKKYSIKDITETDLRSFYGAISLPRFLNYKSRTKYYFITTSKFTKKAIEFAKESNIILVDFVKITELQDVFSLNEFKKKLLLKEGQKEVNRCFNKEQLVIDLNDNVLNTIEATDNEVFQLLRQVRRDFSNMKQLRLGDIARNDTLKLLARTRPHNLKALKDVIEDFPTREKNKIHKYGEIFIERLRYLHTEEINNFGINID